MLTMTITDDGRDIFTGDEFKDKLLDIACYGQIDGSHHRLWVIDQMVREILGDDYEEFVKWYEEDDERWWVTGVAP